VETDFLMTILKQQIAKFPHLKLILMSATMQEEKFQQYFLNCPIYYISGRTFPVSIYYLKDIFQKLKKPKLVNSLDTTSKRFWLMISYFVFSLSFVDSTWFRSKSGFY
jgi:ATP-dependent RNA helicase DHX36